jgi:hypothetical protein
MKNPIPDRALDDRIAIVGTSGSGKTYTAKGCVERILAKKHRVVVVDPLDVWWGLRLDVSGKTPAFPIRILGGKHGDMPLNEHVGAMIGEAIATTTESCIISPASIKTSAGRQRFMIAFLDALYERTNPDLHEPYHVIFDEADLWAPQKPMGQEAMLCHLMEEIVRRGRVKGFIPWLITQRPAVLNKNVLSQADGLIAMSLTASQDRDAIGAWIEGQADKVKGREILATLPALSRGEGVIWIPRQDILKTEQFPENLTFDSSRTPKRGEKKRDVVLAPLDIGALRTKLATVEEQAKANDPKALKAEIARLQGEIAKAPTLETINIGTMVDEVVSRGYVVWDKIELQKALREQREEGFSAGFEEAAEQAVAILDGLRQSALDKVISFADDFKQIDKAKINIVFNKDKLTRSGSTAAVPAAVQTRKSAPIPSPLSSAQRNPSPVSSGDGPLSQRMLDALVELDAIGVRNPPREFVAAMLGYGNVTSKAIAGTFASLRGDGHIDVPGDGRVYLTSSGRAAAAPSRGVMTTDDLRSRVVAVLGAPVDKILNVLLAAYPNTIERADLAQRVGYTNVTSKAFASAMSRLRDMGFIEAGSGAVKAADVFFP